MRIKIVIRPPCGVVYKVPVGSVHEVMGVLGDDDAPRGYYILPEPRTKSVLVMAGECSVVRESAPAEEAR